MNTNHSILQAETTGHTAVLKRSGSGDVAMKVSVKTQWGAHSRSRKRLALSILFILFLLLASQWRASAALVSEDQARAAVRGWFIADKTPLQTIMGQKLKSTETYKDAKGTPLYYVIYLDPEGFIIVAADDLIEPIIGFAPTGRFDPSSSNPLGALVSNDIPGRLARVAGVKAALARGPILEAKTKWDRLYSFDQLALAQPLGLTTVSDIRVAPLIQTKWDQTTAGGNACYNYYTPPYAEGTAVNYPCGCVATAMGQLMRYYQFPVNGVGTAVFNIMIKGSSSTRSLRGGEGSGGAYIWSDMVLDPAAGVTDPQRHAIGALCADAGVAVNMDYGDDAYGGSGTDTLKAKDAFVNTFGYANARKGYSSGSTIGPGLNGMTNPNLDSGCPVLLGITDGSNGHAVVCDGYGYNLNTLYHHLNLGWSGSYTAWYNLPAIDAGGYSFNSVYKCIYNVWPSGTGEIISGRVTDSSGTPLSGVSLTATRSAGGTYSASSNAKGIFALSRIPSSSTYSLSAGKSGYSFENQTIMTGMSADSSANSGNRWAVNFASSVTRNVPFSENFENGGAMPLGWGQEDITSSPGWTFQSGGINGYPASAHGGSGYNAIMYIYDYSYPKTKLISPMIDFGTKLQNAQLTFWHCMTVWSGDQDELRVYYKTSAGGTWTLLATYTTSVASWTQQTIALPNPSSSYYIAFEGNAKYGYGVCIDDVQVTGSVPVNLPPTDIALSPTSIAENQATNAPIGNFSTTDPNPGDTFTYSFASGGTDNSWFTISGNSLLAKYSYDYQTKNIYSILVRSTDQTGLYFDKSFTISITQQPPLSEILVDRTSTAPFPNGTTWAPYPTVLQGYNAVQAGNMIRIVNGDYPEKFDMNKPLTIKAKTPADVINLGKGAP